MRKEKIKRIILFLILVLILYLIHNNYISKREDSVDKYVPVVEVYDGDTVSVILYNREEKVRLIGIDAPEIGQEPWGRRTKKYLETILSSTEWRVRLEFDINKRDKYGRILAYLWTEHGEMINLLMVKNGYALLLTFPPNIKYADALREAQKDARDKRLGIWGDRGLKEKPRDYRMRHPRI